MRGRHWQDDNLAKLLHDGVAEEHPIALCRLGINILPETTGVSSVRYNALTTGVTSASPSALRETISGGANVPVATQSYLNVANLECVCTATFGTFTSLERH